LRFCRTGLARCSYFEAGGNGDRSKRGPVNDRGPVIFSVRSARSVRQRPYATCRPSRMPARQTLWPTPDVPQVCDGAAALAFRSAKSLVIPTVSPPVQSAAQGEHPHDRDRAARRIGKAKDALRGGARSGVGACQTFAEDLGCLVTSVERIHASFALIPRIGSKGPWPAASVDLTKREAGVVRVTCIITRYHHGAGPAPSAQPGALVRFRQNRRRCDGPYIATAILQDLNPQRGSRSEDAGDGESAVDA